MPGGRPRKYQSNEQLQKLINKFFKDCDRKKKPYTITGLGMAIGLDRHQIISYGKEKEFYHTIKEAKDKCENYLENITIQGKTAPAVGIFMLKNYGWTDKQEVEVRAPQGINFVMDLGGGSEDD